MIRSLDMFTYETLSHGSLLTSEMLAFRFFSAVIVQDLSYMIYQVEILEGFFPVLLSESG